MVCGIAKHVTNKFIPQTRVILEKLRIPQTVKKFYWARRFINMFKRARHSPYPSTEQSSLLPALFLEYLFQYHSHVYNHVFQGVSFLRFPHQNTYAPLLSSLRVTYPTHLILLDLITRIKMGAICRSWRSVLCYGLYSTEVAQHPVPNKITKKKLPCVTAGIILSHGPCYRHILLICLLTGLLPCQHGAVAHRVHVHIFSPVSAGRSGWNGPHDRSKTEAALLQCFYR